MEGAFYDIYTLVFLVFRFFCFLFEFFIRKLTRLLCSRVRFLMRKKGASILYARIFHE